ncbi:MAG: YbhB/YbcL family Raf kinase inhibitor-like protein [Desulfurococcales archaeon]|nr:YbhB/YbcL family Raf kinase inhibitor-like protein [Desulfurococcales archaeon]
MRVKGKVIAAVLVIILVGVGALIFGLKRKGGGELVDPFYESMVKGAPKTLHVTTDAIANGRFIVDYTCDGRDKAPTVTVSGIPSDAKALALVMYDPDAPIGTFVHWLLVVKGPFNSDTVQVTSDMGVEGRNDFRSIGYGGPCPPRGHGDHRYFILVMALDKEPTLHQGFTVKDLKKEVEGNVIAWGYVMGKYSR